MRTFLLATSLITGLAMSAPASAQFRCKPNAIGTALDCESNGFGGGNPFGSGNPFGNSSVDWSGLDSLGRNIREAIDRNAQQNVNAATPTCQAPNGQLYYARPQAGRWAC